MKLHPLKTINIKRAQALGLKQYSNPLDPNAREDLEWIAGEILKTRTVDPSVRFAIVQHSAASVCLWRDGLRYIETNRESMIVKAGPTNR